MNNKINAKLNDVFGIPIAEKLWGLGKIVAVYKKNILLVVVFEKSIKGSPKYRDDVLESGLILLGLTQDAKLYHGHWPIVGNDKSDRNIKLPEYLIGPPEKCAVEDFFGNRIRMAEDLDQTTLSYKTIVGPIRFEKALQAIYGVRDWKPEYDMLRIEKG